jgi:hypothetical protein
MLNVPAPTTWNQRVLAAYNSVDAAVQSVQTLVIAGKLGKADAQQAHARAVQLRDAIDLADQLHGSNPTEGEDALAASIKALQALQTELQKRQQS